MHNFSLKIVGTLKNLPRLRKESLYRARAITYYQFLTNVESLKRTEPRPDKTGIKGSYVVVWTSAAFSAGIIGTFLGSEIN